MGDHHRILHVESVQHSSKIGGERVEIVTPPRIARSTVGAAVIRDAAETLLRERIHLVGPHCGAECPARQKYEGLAGSPVTVKQIDSVVGSDEIRFHSAIMRCLAPGVDYLPGNGVERKTALSSKHGSAFN